MFGVEFYDPNYIIVGKFGPGNLEGTSREWEQDTIEMSLTTLDKVTEIKRHFDVTGDYDMYLKDNGEKISIPVNDETKLAKWLQDHGYSADSKIYVVPSSVEVEEFHTLGDNWKDHPTYVLYQDMKALLTGGDPNDVTDTELHQLLHQSRGVILTARISLESGINYFFKEDNLHKWLYVIETNLQLTKRVKQSFVDLIENYRKDNGLALQDPDKDTLIGELRIAIQYDSEPTAPRGPTMVKMNEFFGLTGKNKLFQAKEIGISALTKLLYGLYRKGGAKFVLDNFAKTRVSNERGVPSSVRKALKAINKYCLSKGYFSKITPLQKFMILSSWHISDINGGEKLVERSVIANYFGVRKGSINYYITGRNSKIRDINTITRFETVAGVLSELIIQSQFDYFKKIYDDFYQANSKAFPGVHGIRPSAYTDGWYHPDVVAKHIVELCIRQGGLMPAGKRGEGAENYDVLEPKNRHHIIYNKDSKLVLDLILLGHLHYKNTYKEAKGDLDYYTLMRYMRDSFEAAKPPSSWDKDLQEKYIERLKEFVLEWEKTKSSIRYTDSKTGKKVDFISIRYNKVTYNIEAMIEMGWITTGFIDRIITDIRMKLEDQEIFF